MKIIIVLAALYFLSKFNKPSVPATQKTVSNPLPSVKGTPYGQDGVPILPGPALTAPYYSGNGDIPNTLAPNPLPNPTFEKTVPIIANRLVVAARSPYISQRWLV